MRQQVINSNEVIMKHVENFKLIVKKKRFVVDRLVSEFYCGMSMIVIYGISKWITFIACAINALFVSFDREWMRSSNNLM